MKSIRYANLSERLLGQENEGPEMPNLGEATKLLVAGGEWGLNEYGENDYILSTGSSCACCNPRGQKFFKIDSDGNFLREATKEEYLRPITAYLRFPYPPDYPVIRVKF